jgi:DNA mismatch endonuclease (patch repair protein)
MSRRSIDIAFTKHKVAVFLDGCFWHSCPNHATSPKANAAWWRAKLDRNVMRDRETTEHLSASGWVVLRFWEHEEPAAIAERVRDVVMARRQAVAG